METRRYCLSAQPSPREKKSFHVSGDSSGARRTRELLVSYFFFFSAQSLSTFYHSNDRVNARSIAILDFFYKENNSVNLAV